MYQNKIWNLTKDGSTDDAASLNRHYGLGGVLFLLHKAKGNVAYSFAGRFAEAVHGELSSPAHELHLVETGEKNNVFTLKRKEVFQ